MLSLTLFIAKVLLHICGRKPINFTTDRVKHLSFLLSLLLLMPMHIFQFLSFLQAIIRYLLWYLNTFFEKKKTFLLQKYKYVRWDMTSFLISISRMFFSVKNLFIYFIHLVVTFIFQSLRIQSTFGILYFAIFI